MSQDYGTERHRRRSSGRGHQRRKKKGKGCLIFFGILLILLGVVGAAFAYFYSNISTTVEKIQTERPSEQVNLRSESQSNLVKAKKPFSVLLLGVDTGEYGRVDQGRSDIMVVATINPNTKTMTLTSIPRDTLTEIVGYGTEDKINHAYAFGGVAMSANSVQNLLQIPIDFTISANMQGFEDIIDTLGGITITSVDTFSQEGYSFVEGQTYNMNGAMALEYSRNRYDTGGDYSRQDRARQLVEGIIDSAVSFDSLTNLPAILDSLGGNVLTDLTFSDMQKIALDYRDAIGQVQNLQLTGSGQMIDGIYYEIIDPASLAQVQSTLQDELDYNE